MRSRWLILLALSFLMHPGYGLQCPNSIPNLNSYGTGSYSARKVGQSCLPLTVNVKNRLPGSINVRTLFDYRGAPINPDSLKTDTLHTYTRPGKYQVVQFSELNGSKLIACPTVYVYDTLPPKVRVVACGTTTAKLIFDESQPAQYESHWIKWGDGTIQEVFPRLKTVSHTYSGSGLRKIVVWGTINPGLCRSNDVVLDFDGSTLTTRPVITRLEMQTSNKGELTVANPASEPLLLYRKSATSDWESTGRILSEAEERLEVVVDSLAATCFRVESTDTCTAQRYKSDPICSGLLSVEARGRNFDVSFKSDLLAQMPQGRAAIIKDGTAWYSAANSAVEASLIDEKITCRTEHCYQLTISNNNSRFISMPVCRLTPSEVCGSSAPISIPDAFSPNGDGVNDVLFVNGVLEAGTPYEFTVFDGWGTAIFNSANIGEGWDGRVNGQAAPPGYYPYRIRYQLAGEPISKTGSVTIVR